MQSPYPERWAKTLPRVLFGTTIYYKPSYYSYGKVSLDHGYLRASDPGTEEPHTLTKLGQASLFGKDPQTMMGRQPIAMEQFVLYCKEIWL